MTNMTRLMIISALVFSACKGKTQDATKPTTTETAPAAKPTEVAAAKPATAQDLVKGTALSIGDASLTFDAEETNKGGDNQAPTQKGTVTAKCGGKDVTVLEREDEGGDYKVNARTADKLVTVTMSTHIAREGETLDESDIATLDLATCTVTKK